MLAMVTCMVAIMMHNVRTKQLIFSMQGQCMIMHSEVY